MPDHALPTMPKPICRAKVRREDLRPGEVLCSHCAAKCCRYFALPIDTPKDWQDFDFIRWYLLHEGAAIFTDEGCWYLLVNNRCKHLRDDQRCDIYDTRPQICRDYTTADCEFDDEWLYDHYWETPGAGRGICRSRARAARRRKHSKREAASGGGSFQSLTPDP